MADDTLSAEAIEDVKDGMTRYHAYLWEQMSHPASAGISDHTRKRLRRFARRCETILALIARNRALEAKLNSESRDLDEQLCMVATISEMNTRMQRERDDALAEIASLKAERERLIATGNAMAGLVEAHANGTHNVEPHHFRVAIKAWRADSHE